jgi:hypothetical protein
MTRRRFDLTLPPELADMVLRVIEEEHTFDASRFMPPRPVTSILQSLVAAGLELRHARQNLETSQDLPRLPTSSEKPEKPLATSRKR